MYRQQRSERQDSSGASRSYRREGTRGTNVDSPSIDSPTSPQSPSSGRSPAASRGNARGGGSSSRAHETLQTTAVSKRPLSTGPSSPLETANKHFPLHDIDYESNPAAVAQELSNLQALRRMSMDASSASDPDLPGFSLSNFTAPTGADDDLDARRLFWVPARLHPELAPEGWKAFVEAKVKEIRSPSGGKDGFLSAGNQGGQTGLRRKKSMLSRQIDNTGGKAAEQYEDGAERLERRRSQNGGGGMLKVSDLENLVNDPSSLLRKLSVSPAGKMGPNGKIDEDLPILPPLGQTLRRSTRTTYRKERGGHLGGLGSGRSKRVNRGGADTDTEDYSPGNSPGSPNFILQRVQTEPISLAHAAANRSHSRPNGLRTPELNQSRAGELRESNDPKDSAVRNKPAVSTPGTVPTPSSSFEDMLANSTSIPPLSNTVSSPKSSSSKPSRRSTSPTHPPQPHGRRESQDRGVPIPRIVETPPTEQTQQAKLSEKPSSQQSTQQSPSKPSKRPQLVRQEGSSNLAEAARPSSAGRESLVPNPTSEAKRTGRSDSVGSSTRKSSWGWLVGDSGKEREKEQKEKVSEKDGEKSKSKKSKSSKIEKSVDKEKDHARLDVIQKSIDGKESSPHDKGGDGGRDKEKADASGSRKSNTQEAAGSKKEKDSGLFSSFFGGSRKKSGSESHKAKSARNASPERPHVQQNFYYTRFPIHIERAIYRLSHLKLANPRRPLLQQVLLSNFMYSYLAKVQMTQPTLLQQQQQQQQQQLQQQQEAQEAYEQQLYQQQQAQFEQQQIQYEQAEQYYQYEDVSASISIIEESANNTSVGC